MITLKSYNDIQSMRKGGQILTDTLKALLKEVEAEVSLLELDKKAYNLIVKAGASPSFLGYRGYPASLCISVNEGVVHGIPNAYRLCQGDIVSLDAGVCYQGFHTDASTTVIVGQPPLGADFKEKNQFLEVGKEALARGIENARQGLRVGDISAAIEKVITAEGYAIIKELTGHGVGRALHEDPYIPGFGRPGTGEVLQAGMTLAVEVIYAKNRPQIKTLSDGWTIVTRDKSWGGLFEKTILVTRNTAEVLTLL